jgi:hypothetical protein
MDHYLDVSFDLSKVLFIATANVPDTIPGPLRDRMEVIRISGYTHQEKVQIARKYLWPQAMEEHGLTEAHVELLPDGLNRVIENYTQEAGVRSLKRELASVCRWVAKQVASDKAEGQIVVTAELVEEIRGPIHYWKDVAERTAVAGVCHRASPGRRLAERSCSSKPPSEGQEARPSAREIAAHRIHPGGRSTMRSLSSPSRRLSSAHALSNRVVISTSRGFR